MLVLLKAPSWWLVHLGEILGTYTYVFVTPDLPLTLLLCSSFVQYRSLSPSILFLNYPMLVIYIITPLDSYKI